VKYAWIKAQIDFPIVLMCEMLEVSSSAFYDWCKRPISTRERENKKLAVLVKTIFEEQRDGCGTRTIKKVLSRLEVPLNVSRRRIGRIMDEETLECITVKKFKITTDSKHNKPIACNVLNREFTAEKVNQKWVGDITYVWTAEGWLYLATVIDLFSRRVVGWSMDKRMTASLVNDALLGAIWSRKPDKGLIWHTDRGSQYASNSHRRILNEHGVIQSMSRKGNCWDNSVAESFFGTLKTGLINHKQYQTRNEAKEDIFDYIEVFYNRKRLHSTNDYWSPVDYEEMMEVS
jgi:putative transposase